MHLLLVRHGQSFVNLDDWDAEHVDAGLTPLGKRQAASLAGWLIQNVTINVLYTSTMARALETAAYLTEAAGITAQPDDRLREFGNCYSDGKPIPLDSMPIRYDEFWTTRRPYTPIGANVESWLLFRVRVGSFLDDVLARHASGETGATVVVVCHAGVIDATFDYVCNVGAYRRVEVWTHNTGIVHWEYVPESAHQTWRLHAHGLVNHLTTDQGEWLGGVPIMRDAGQRAASAGHEMPGEKGEL